jgi:hypothetical protein
MKQWPEAVKRKRFCRDECPDAGSAQNGAELRCKAAKLPVVSNITNFRNLLISSDLEVLGEGVTKKP